MPQSIDIHSSRLAKAEQDLMKLGFSKALDMKNVDNADAMYKVVHAQQQQGGTSQPRTNLSRLRQRFQQVAAKALPITTVGKLNLAQGNNNGTSNNWAQFTNAVALRNFEETNDHHHHDDSLRNLMQAFAGPVLAASSQVEQLMEINLEDSNCDLRYSNQSLNNNNQIFGNERKSAIQAVRKVESEPDLMKNRNMFVDIMNDEPIALQGKDKADSKVSSLSTLSFPMQMRPNDKPILVLDLDETLIHSSLVPRRPADFWIEVIQNGDMRTREVFWVYKRPGVDAFLQAVAQQYTVLIFTAGIKEYAAQILDELDPDDKIFAGRLYRDSCTETRGLHPSMIATTAHPSAYAKDMTRVCDDLSRVLLVDNTPGCFALQPANGLAIKSWYADQGDRQLSRLQDFLCEIKDVQDVRLVLPEWKV